MDCNITYALVLWERDGEGGSVSEKQLVFSVLLQKKSNSSKIEIDFRVNVNQNNKTNKKCV